MAPQTPPTAPEPAPAELPALRADVDRLTERLSVVENALADRIATLEEALDIQEAAHERELSRLRDQHRDAEYQTYDLERQVRTLKDALRRAESRPAAGYGRW